MPSDNKIIEDVQSKMDHNFKVFKKEHEGLHDSLSRFTLGEASQYEVIGRVYNAQKLFESGAKMYEDSLKMFTDAIHPVTDD